MTSRQAKKVVAIVGGGFCGTMLAVHLLQRRHAASLDIVLINRPHANPAAANAPGTLARGLAYGTNSESHLLNVPAGRMSAWEAWPDHFLAFLNRSDPDIGGGHFAPRHRYGEYLQSLLAESARLASPDTAFSVAHETVVDVSETAAGQLKVGFAHGGALVADAVVLALGNFAPAVTAPLSTFMHAPGWPGMVRDPWEPGALAALNLDLPVLAIGTGLTLYDVAASLSQLATARHTPLNLHAVSRRGLTPQPHRDDLSHPHFALPARLGDAVGRVTRTREWLRLLREAATQATTQGGDWRDVLAALRPVTPAIWHSLPPAERKRFLRHAKPYWESHRHRAAPKAASTIATLRAEGTLRVQAARLLSVMPMQEGKDGYAVTLAKRGGGEERLHVGSIVNCTGPSADIRHEPLLTRLAERGWLQPDALGQGLRVGAGYRPESADPARPLFYVGPLLKARDWEATAVPELRVHVARCADEIAALIR